MSQMALKLIDLAKRDKWKRLDLGDCGIEGSVPVEIWELEALEELILCEVWIELEGADYFVKKTKNNGPSNKITHFPAQGQSRPGLSCLKKLFLGGNPIRDVASLAKLEELQFLALYNTNVRDIAPLAQLVKLKHLFLWDTNVFDIHPLSRLTELETLDLEGTQAQDFSPLAKLTKLQRLDLNNTSIFDLSSITKLSQLKELRLRGTRIMSISPLAKLSLIETLDLSNTNVSDISALENLIYIHTLHLDNTKIRDISPIHQLFRLRYLSLFFTSISDISSLTKLNQLQNILLSSTQVNDLSPLKDLIKSGLPIFSHFRELGRENGIFIQDCPLVNPPIEIARKGKEAILEYWQESEAQESYPILEAKMLIVGEGGAGKTSLLRRIVSPHSPMLKESESTKGIDIVRYSFPISRSTDNTNLLQPLNPENPPIKKQSTWKKIINIFKTKSTNSNENKTTFIHEKITLNIWDFGGQEIYHATHQFFFSKRAIYILVDDTKKDDSGAEDLRYRDWLEMIEVMGGNSPVLIFQNEKSGRSKSLDQEGIRKRFPNVDKEFFGGDLSETKSADLVRTAIQDRAQSLEHIREKWPKAWFDMREELQTLSTDKPTISLENYHELYTSYINYDPEKALFLSAFLHDLGALLHYQEDKLLRELLILRNTWATDAVYCILDDESIKRKNGYFTEADCERLWPEIEYRGKHMQLRQLMLKFELCYALRDCTPETWLAPQLLPQTPPAHGFTPSSSDILLQYHYDLMPKGMVNRLMVRMNRHIQNPGHAWRNGALFEGKDAQVLVNIPYGKKEIHFRARGVDARTLLLILSDDLQALNSTFQGLKGRVILTPIINYTNIF